MTPSERDGFGGAAANDICIAATATAVPDHRIGREEVKTYFGAVFGIDPARVEAMMNVIDHSEIRQRYCIHPVEYIIQARPLSRLSQEYAEHALRLGRRVTTDCLARAGMRAEEIDLLITVSCTGVMIPSLDAHLINGLGFRSSVRRLPITELGCAAGAAALALAADFLRGVPGGKVLIVAVELPSLAFQRGDLSPANLVSTALFGDGAAAAVVTRGASLGPRIVDTESYLFPNSIDAMGFDLRETGFHIVLSKDVPQMIREKIGGLTAAFLGRHGLARQDARAFILHPGGQKLMLFIEEELGLPRELTRFSWDVLREYGNLSSASVLFVLQEWIERGNLPSGAYGLLAAFGPGFSAEMLLLQWP